MIPKWLKMSRFFDKNLKEKAPIKEPFGQPNNLKET